MHSLELTASSRKENRTHALKRPYDGIKEHPVRHAAGQKEKGETKMMKLMAMSLLLSAAMLVTSGCSASEEYYVTASGVQGQRTEAPAGNYREETDPIDELVSAYNRSGNYTLEYVESFDTTDRHSGHYKIEFKRWGEGTGKSYRVGDQTVDIVATRNGSSGARTMLTALGLDYDLCIDLIRYMSPQMDPSVTSKQVEGAIGNVKENAPAGRTVWYCYGDLQVEMAGYGNIGFDICIEPA